MPVQTKICGINSPEALEAALKGGARYVGFVFYPPSPRYLSPPLAAELIRMVPTGVRAVGLFVSPTDALLDDVSGQVPLDYLQLHDDEPPERLGHIRARFALPLIKAFRLGAAADLERVPDYAAIADLLLFSVAVVWGFNFVVIKYASEQLADTQGAAGASLVDAGIKDISRLLH